MKERKKERKKERVRKGRKEKIQGKTKRRNGRPTELSATFDRHNLWIDFSELHTDVSIDGFKVSKIVKSSLSRKKVGERGKRGKKVCFLAATTTTAAAAAAAAANSSETNSLIIHSFTQPILAVKYWRI